MGLRGYGAKPKQAVRKRKPSVKQEPWRRAGLTRAQRVIAFVEVCPITAGRNAGKLLKLRPFQLDFINSVYAENESGQSPVRTAVFSIARKNGKTGLCAPLALCHLVGPEAETRGEVYSAANDTTQSGRLFSEIVAILQRMPTLDSRVNVVHFVKEIRVLSGDGEGSLFKALSADASTKMGLSPSCIVVDELGSAPSRALFDALDTSMGARENPLMLVISTQAASDLHVLSTLIDYGKRVHCWRD